MKLPMSWLRSLVHINCDTNEFAERMTISGSKVEGVEILGDEISGVVVGRVISLEKHLDSDKLFITRVDVGNKQLQIVTGAQNLYEGAYVPVALVGATLAGGVEIKESELRGVKSQGMLVSIEELGHDRSEYPEAPEHGIYIFEFPTILGTDAKKELMLSDEVVEFELTSNRPDCYSVMGLAREAAATFDLTLHEPNRVPKELGQGQADEYIKVEIKDSDLCPRYIARIVQNVKIGPSPLWMRQRLMAAGLRPINNIVDITNYVMLEMGQPMHAFDISCISGGKIIVRRATENETIVTLDGETRNLDTNMLLIADENRGVGIAGVMGGENSKITDGASAVLFESACFNGPNIRSTAKKLGLRTDASGRFEKGLDPNLAEAAVNRAMALVEELNAGQVVHGMVDCYPEKRSEHNIPFDYKAINALLGTDISVKEMEKLLTRVYIKADGEKGEAIIPTFRADVEMMADLAEEVGRIYGFDKIKSTISSHTPTLGKRTERQRFDDKLRGIMMVLGYCEALSYAFESPKVFDKLRLSPDSIYRKAVTIRNPLGEDFSVMRTKTENALLTSLSLNYNRRNPQAWLFEMAKTYIPHELPLIRLPNEPKLITMGGYGNMDFYTLKGHLEAIFRHFNVGKLEFNQSSHEFLHPGRQAEVTSNGRVLGYLGEFHPEVLESYEIETPAYVAVLELDALFASRVMPIYRPLPKFPSVKRDLSMIVDESLTVAAIQSVIKSAGGQFLDDVALFDIYRGEHVPEGKKSLAFGLLFRSMDRTLTEDEVNTATNQVTQALDKELDIKIRGL